MEKDIKIKQYEYILPYKGKYYGKGTEVTLTPHYCNTHSSKDNKKLWQYARFGNYVSSNNTYFFSRSRCSVAELKKLGYSNSKEIEDCQWDYASFFTIPASELDAAIDQIIVPRELSERTINSIIQSERVEKERLKSQYPFALTFYWIIYLLVLFFSLIFTEFYLIWIIATVIFYFAYKALKEEITD